MWWERASVLWFLTTHEHRIEIWCDLIPYGMFYVSLPHCVRAYTVRQKGCCCYPVTAAPAHTNDFSNWEKRKLREFKAPGHFQHTLKIQCSKRYCMRDGNMLQSMFSPIALWMSGCVLGVRYSHCGWKPSLTKITCKPGGPGSHLNHFVEAFCFSVTTNGLKFSNEMTDNC